MRLSKLKYLLILPFLCLSLWAFSWGAADIFAYQVNRYERSWQVDGAVESLEEWDKAKYWATLSSKLNGSHPDYSETLGRLFYWRFFVKSDPVKSIEEQNEYLNQGLVHFRLAIEKRPTWPQTWARLLRLKSITGNLDEEYWYAWDKSQELGRWEAFVQEELLQSGLQHWENLTAVQQDKVMSVFLDMISKTYSDLTALALIDFYEKSSEICAKIPPARLKKASHTKGRCAKFVTKNSIKSVVR